MARTDSSTRRIDTEALKLERPLEDVVASYGIALRREGNRTYRGRCPFHQEHTPSFWIDARDPSCGHYYCFGCGEHGDVVTFVMAREECSFVEACERLSSRGRLPRLEPAPRRPEASSERRWEQLTPDSPEVQLLDRVLRCYEDRLWNSERARRYLAGRGISEEVARAQRVGYADGHSLTRMLREDADLRRAVDLGLVLERPGRDERPTYREFFVDRLIIPELRAGRPIWFIGRAVEGVSEGPSAGRPRPKYLGLAGEKPILGLERVQGRRAVYLVEGPFDVLAGTGWALPTFAICGTHFPRERVPALSEAVAVYGVFDPDRAGRSAAERFASVFGSRWRPVSLPNTLDLAELAAHGEPGRETFDALVGRARAAAWQRASGF